MKKLALVLAAIIPLTLAACSDTATTETRTVRLAVQRMSQEVTHTPVWAGDSDGSGSALFTVTKDQTEVCWELTVSNILLPASSAHIHKAAPGVRGPIVVELSPPGANGTATGCAQNVDLALLTDILAAPEGYYVNVHTTEFPAGAVRGQLR